MYDQQRTQPYNGQQQTGRIFLHQFRHGSGRMVIIAFIVGVLGLALGAASLTLLMLNKGTITTQAQQIRQLQQSVVAAQQSNQGNASSISGLSAKVGTIGAAEAVFAPYTTTCSQALVNQSGSTGLYYYPCSAQRP